MDIDDKEQFDGGIGSSFPDYWKMFKDYNIADLKNSAEKQFQKDPTGQQFKKYMITNASKLLQCYIYGLQKGLYLSIKMNFDEFSTFVFIINVVKNVKQNNNTLKPEPMKPTKLELDVMFDKDKIQSEISDMYRELGLE